MSEIKTRLSLRFSDGRYLSWDKSNYPLTHKISEARRFVNTEQIADFLENSYYRPAIYGMDAGDFEIVTVEIEYREVEPSVQDVGIDK